MENKETSKICDLCGKTGLVWKQDDRGKWYLEDITTGKQHYCGKRRF